MKLPGILIAAALCAAAAVGQAFADAPATDDMVDRRIAQLIEQLGDKQFAARQRAQQELVKLGFDAFDALADAEASDDPEIAMQAGYLVRLIRAEWTREGDPRPVQQILKDYEQRQAAYEQPVRFKELSDRQTETMLTSASVARAVCTCASDTATREAADAIAVR